MTIPEITALCLGTVVVLVALGSWAWRQTFGVAGASFLVCGVSLIGFPVFGDIQFKAPGIEVSLEQRIEKAFKEDPEITIAAINNSVSMAFDDTLDGNTKTTNEQMAEARLLLQRWKQQNEELSHLSKVLHDQSMTPIRNIR